ncbi:hypothetical protein HY312_04550 [Candidatus Saccharibacteria bacterium]|nr:hypothetical protein [Candidatus Saccharibacteria bacterium]
MILLTIFVCIVFVLGFVVFRGAPYVPSMKKYAAQSLDELYHVTKKDVLIDVGSGDGVILRLAAERGARAIGYELNPILVLMSKLLSRGNPLVETKLADFWLTALPAETTVVYAFSVGRDMKKLANKMQQTATRAQHPIWLITYGHSIPKLKPNKSTNSHYLYLFEPKQ